MIAGLVPEHVLVAEASGDDGEGELLPEERAVVASAVPRRQTEFAQGRTCVHRVLEPLGWAGFPVLAGAHREPLWPEGIMGSITHCAGYVAAAAARRADLSSILGLGIDAEVRTPLDPEVRRLVLTEREERLLARAPDPSLAAAVFSAKEAVYKCWFPLTGCWLDYQDAEIELDPGQGRFGVHLVGSAPRPPQPLLFAGRLAVTATHVFTVATATRR